MKTISTEILINAGSEKVWEVLSDFPSYPEWNPFITRISGNLQPWDKLDVTLQIEGRKPTSFNPTVISMVPGEKFCWKGKLFIKGIFDGTHYFLLEKMEDGGTRFTQGENFGGILAGPILRKIEPATLAGFKAMNNALKDRSEK